MITATTSSGTTTYTYDYENRLTNVEVDGTMVATYTYDALGQRIGIKDNGTQTWTAYNGNSADANPYADFNSSGGLQTRYLDGLAVDKIYGQTNSSGSTQWYLTDQVDSVVAIASTSAVLDQITYDPFGNIVTQTNATDAVRFGFAGMEYDSTTGLYYDHARYYDAAIGRFTSQDPKGFAAGDTNLYRYVGNDPTGNTDPSGLTDWGRDGAILLIDPGFNPNGRIITYIPEDYQKELPTPAQRSLPSGGGALMVDAVLVEGIGLYKLRNGAIGVLTNDPTTGDPVVVPIAFVPTPWWLGAGTQIFPTSWGVSLYPVNQPNTFGPHGDVPGGNDETNLPPPPPQPRYEGRAGAGRGSYS
jgi:RHS repeat-associated protein